MACACKCSEIEALLAAQTAALIAALPSDASITSDVSNALVAGDVATATDVADAVMTLLTAIGGLPSDASIVADVLSALATFGVDGWQRVSGSAVFGVGGIVANPGSVLYTPTARIELVRGLVLVGNLANPLVPVGAATLAVGVKISGTVTAAGMIPVRAPASYNTALESGGSDASTAPSASFLVLAAAAALSAGSPSRSLRIWTDAGACSGTIDYSFERKVVLP